jgi:hypothetical protein
MTDVGCATKPQAKRSRTRTVSKPVASTLPVLMTQPHSARMMMTKQPVASPHEAATSIRRGRRKGLAGSLWRAEPLGAHAVCAVHPPAAGTDGESRRAKRVLPAAVDWQLPCAAMHPCVDRIGELTQQRIPGHFCVAAELTHAERQRLQLPFVVHRDRLDDARPVRRGFAADDIDVRQPDRGKRPKPLELGDGRIVGRGQRPSDADLAGPSVPIM